MTIPELKYPGNLGFALLALAAVLFFGLAIRKKEKIMASFRFLPALRFKALRVVSLGLGTALMLTALLGPQVFTGYTQLHKTGMDIYVLIDTSKSMGVRDIEPDRITVAKKIVANLLDHLEGDRIGFIPFASDAYIQMPLTDDYRLARMFLDVVDTDMISGGGTNLAAAIRLANDSFNRVSGGDRVLLILSDGEEHEGVSLDIIKGITDEQTKIFTIGMGTEKGGLVPIYGGPGNAAADYMKDESGNPVTSRLHADTLIELARSGRGAYFQADLQGAETTGLLTALSALKRGELESAGARRYKPLFQYFLGPGVLLVILAWFLPDRRRSA